MKTSSRGIKEWEKTFGGPSYDYLSSARQTADGGYILTGSTYSYGADNMDAYS